MNFYLAGRVSRMDELKDYRADLESLGHTVTSRWLNNGVSGHANRGDMTTIERAVLAERDIKDILRSEAVIIFTEDRLSQGWRPSAGDGRLVEFGYAMGRNKICYAVGPRENLFMCMHNVYAYGSWRDFLHAIEAVNWKEEAPSGFHPSPR